MRPTRGALAGAAEKLTVALPLPCALPVTVSQVVWLVARHEQRGGAVTLKVPAPPNDEMPYDVGVSA